MGGSRLWSPMVAPLLTSSVTPAVTYQQALKTVSGGAAPEWRGVFLAMEARMTQLRGRTIIRSQAAGQQKEKYCKLQMVSWSLQWLSEAAL